MLRSLSRQSLASGPLACLSLVALWLFGPAFAAAAPRAIDFNRDIKPILSNNCYFCHGPDEAERKGGTDGLRLDTLEGAKADLGGHAAVVPGKPDKSELLRRVLPTAGDEIMPPAETGKHLSPQEIELLTEWIRQGAPYAPHWSYARPVAPEVPAVKNAAWPNNEIDRFLLHRLEREGLQPQPEADRHTLIRRVALDLTGLPPTPAEVEAFVQDQSPNAYEKLVDRLLQKEAYGEHWAHHWLDLARYADSAGYADDPPRTIWLFRDYVIRSFNANKPFDQFTIEQIAGDLLPNPTDDQLTATAFHRNTLTNNEGGTNDEEFRNVAVVDRVNTTLAVWMGTTIACAQCHTHKYDPLSQKEYFSLFAIFNNSEDADRRDESPLLSRYSPAQLERKGKLEAELAAAKLKLSTSTPEIVAARTQWEAKFPRTVAWQTLTPGKVSATSNAAAAIQNDGSVLVKSQAENDRYTVELPVEAGKLRALRLEALADDALAGKGPGNSGSGNFVVTGVTATLDPLTPMSPRGRFVRIAIPGGGKILSLAEVQVLSGTQNVALTGEARQSTTDYEGPAKYAIDGNTNGDYLGKSVTHTAQSADPWWEVDLKSELPVVRIVIWNRTDGNVGSRLADFQISLLDEKRTEVWSQKVAKGPEKSAEYSLSGSRQVEFAVAVADYSQPQFDAASVLKPDASRQKGWAIGGKTGEPHTLTLVAKKPVEITGASKLTVTIDQQSMHKQHTLGKFRLSVSDAADVQQWAATPAAVIAALQFDAPQRTKEQADTIEQHYLSIAPELKEARDQAAALQKQLSDLKPDTVPIMKEMAGKGRVTRLQHRGNYLDQGDEVQPGSPAIFPPLDKDVPVRLALARWLVADENPLTARVVANRYWEQIFGIGIVATSEEFGSQGELPFHPELLDWLATDLVRNRWDLKAFVKKLVMSAAYRQSSRVTPELQQLDPENRLLARGPRFRLSAEMVRDQALAVSGLLTDKMYGPPVKPMQPTMGLSAAFGGGIDWQTSDGADRYRRGLYTTWRRSNPYPSMATFDAPNREVCTVRRVRTNTPLQALVTLNDPVYIEAAQALARKIVTSGGASPAERVQYAVQTCLSRPATADEVGRLVQLFERSRAKFQTQPEAARKLASEPLGSLPKAMDPAELAAWTVVGNVLLNLDEALMKR
jgi:mono/diheme cytochrome c family protein